MKACLIISALATLAVVSAWAVAPPAPVLATPVVDLVRQLGADRFAIREQATHALEGRDDALPAIQEATKSEDAEVRFRARRLVRHLQARLVQRLLDKVVPLFASGDVDRAVDLLVARSDQDPHGKFLEPVFRTTLNTIRSVPPPDRVANIDPEIVKRFSVAQPYRMVRQADSSGPHRKMTLEFLMGVVRTHSLHVRSQNESGSVVSSVVIASGEVNIQNMLLQSIVLANGPVEAQEVTNCLIVCDDAVKIGQIASSIVIARGPVTCEQVIRGSIFSGHTVTALNRDACLIRERLTTFPGGIRFFELKGVGLDVEDTKDCPVVRAVLPGKVLSACPLRAKDIITAAGGEKVTTTQQFRRLVRAALVQQRKLNVTVKRGTEVKTLEIGG